jgi:ankyrin repeat protein
MTHSKNTALHLTAALGDEKMLEYLLENGLHTVCHENSNGLTPVQIAYQNGHQGIVRSLLQHTQTLPPNMEGPKVQIDLTFLN